MGELGDLSPRLVSGEIDDIGNFSDLPVFGDAMELPDDPVERLPV